MDLEFRLKRIALRDSYTIGHLYVYENGDWKFLCDTLEDKVRDLNKNGRFDNGEYKVYGETAIPYGRYEIDMNTVSPKFSKYDFYKKVCNGYLPRLKNVNHFDGILLHCAEGYNGARLLQGCIGIGENKIVGGLLNCKNTFIKVYDILNKANQSNKRIWIEIV